MDSIYADIKRDLLHNLNTWPRIQGDDKCDEAHEHFYNVVFSDERLQLLGQLEKKQYAPWGSIHDGQVYGGFYNKKWIGVSLRWARDARTWAIEESGGIKQVRTALTAKKQFKPQIVVMFEDPKVWDVLIKEYKAKGGGNKNVQRLAPTVVNDELFKKTRIIPIEVWIQCLKDNKPTEPDYDSYLDDNSTGSPADGLRLKDQDDDSDSMFKDDYEAMLDRRLEDVRTKQHLEGMESLGRKALSLWNLTYED